MRRGLRLAMLVMCVLTVGSFAYAALRDEESRNRIVSVFDDGPALPATMSTGPAHNSVDVLREFPLAGSQ